MVLTSSDLCMLTDEWCRFLPLDLDCIIGIPRAGLIVANQISLNLATSLSTPENFLRGEVWQSFSLNKIRDFKKVLVVDDAYGNGFHMETAVNKLRECFPNILFLSASLIKCYDCLEDKRLDYFFMINDGSFVCSFDVPKFSWRFEFLSIP